MPNTAITLKDLDNGSFTPEQMAIIQMVISQSVNQAVNSVLTTQKAHKAKTFTNAIYLDAPKRTAVKPRIQAEPAKPERKVLNTTVDPIRDKDDIKRLANYLLHNSKRYGPRNYLFFILGTNVGLRGSDIVKLRYEDVLNPDGSVREQLGFNGTIKEQKTGKYRKQWMNAMVQDAVATYVKAHPCANPTDFLFPSQKSSTGDHISRKSMGEIIKPAAVALHIPGNINTHSMRKTWAYHIFKDNQETPEILAYLQEALNHSSAATTLRYIGLSDDRKREMFMSNVLG